MPAITDTVLPLIRSYPYRGDSNFPKIQARLLNDAVDLIESWPRDDVFEIYQTCTVALEETAALLIHAPDPDGHLAGALQRLVGLHPRLAAEAKVSAEDLREWMIVFQFFAPSRPVTLDPVDYVSALGEEGIAGYAADLAEIGRSPKESRMSFTQDGPEPLEQENILLHQQLRMAVLTGDYETIIHAGRRYLDPVRGEAEAARALEEIGRFDEALVWARSAAQCHRCEWAYDAAARWWRLAEQYASHDVWPARLAMFRSRRNLANACGLFAVSSPEQWADVRFEVLGDLEAVPHEAVRFVHEVLRDVQYAWDLAQLTELDDFETWNKVAWGYAKVDAVATVPVYLRLVECSLASADVQTYRRAATRLIRIREWTRGTPLYEDVSRFIMELRQRYPRRTRMQREFDLAGLP